MIATNLLLSYGFAIVAAFTNAVFVPDASVPKSTDDLSKYRAPLLFPTDILMQTKDGTTFDIRNGAVHSFSCADSYRMTHDPDQLWRFQGESEINEDEAVAIATAALGKLARSGNPLANITPSVKGEDSVPFFRVEWTKTFLPSEAAPRDASDATNSRFHWISTDPRQRTIAEVEIDGRTKRIVYLSLRDYGFEDQALEREMMKAVVSGYEEPIAGIVTDEYQPQGPEEPRPTTNYVLQAIRNYQDFCRRCNGESDPEIRLENVDWSRTLLYVDTNASSNSPVCQLHFKDTACFESVDACLFGFYAKDAAYAETHRGKSVEEWRSFIGTPREDWEKLATNFENILLERFRIPRECLDPLCIWPPMIRHPALGDELLLRVNLWWMPRDHVSFDPPERPAIIAEFDLSNGLTKAVAFTKSRFIQAVTSTQRPFHAACPTVGIAPAKWVRGVRHEQGAFAVFRDAGLRLPLSVPYTTSVQTGGKADNAPATNSITIPPGETCANIFLRPAEGDPATQTNESVVLTLLPPSTNTAGGPPAYVIGPLSSATNQVGDQ